MLNRLWYSITGINGYETMGEALRALLAKYNWELNGNYVFVTKDDTGRYFADINKPSKGIVISSFASPF